MNEDDVAGGGQVVLARRRERQVAEGPLAVRAQQRHQVAQLLDAGVAEVDPLDLEQHAGHGRIDRQRAQPADHLEEAAIVVDPLEAHARDVGRRHQRRAPLAVEVDAPGNPRAAGAGAGDEDRDADHGAEVVEVDRHPKASRVSLPSPKVAAVPRGTFSPSP